MKIRPATTVHKHALIGCRDHLALAIEHAKKAECPGLLKKLRSARASLGGAERHLSTRLRATQP